MLRNGLEPWHLILVALVFLVLFGYKRLPDAARGLGKSVRILKAEARAMKTEGGENAGTSAAGTAGHGESAPPAVGASTVRTPGEPARHPADPTR